MNCLQETLRRLHDQFYSDQWLSNCFSTSFKSDIPPGTDKFCVLSQAEPFLSGIRIVVGLRLCLEAYSRSYKRLRTSKQPQNNPYEDDFTASRNRIALDVHDGACAVLTATILSCSSAWLASSQTTGTTSSSI